MGNVKSAIHGTYHVLSKKHFPRYLAEFCYRFNRRFQMDTMVDRLTYGAVVWFFFGRSQSTRPQQGYSHTKACQRKYCRLRISFDSFSALTFAHLWALSVVNFPLKVSFNLPESLLTYLSRSRVVENPRYLFYLYDRILLIDTVRKKTLERSGISFHCCREITYPKISDKITFLFEIPVFFNLMYDLVSLGHFSNKCCLGNKRCYTDISSG